MQLATLRGVVGERHALGVRFEEEVERVVDRSLGDEVDFDAHFADALGERQSGNVIALRILLPVDEVERRLDQQRVGQDRRAAVRSRPQANELRRQADRPIVSVVCDVIQSNVYRHRPIMLAGFRMRRS